MAIYERWLSLIIRFSHARQRIDTLQSKLNRINYSINKQSDAKKERVMKHLATRTSHYRSLNFLRAILNRIKFRISVRAERRNLLELDDDRLHDIGVSRKDALHEAQRSFGDLPPDRSQDASGLKNSTSSTPICGLCGRRFMTAG